MEASTTIRLWQAIGLTTSAFGSGFLFSISHITTPAIGLAPSPELALQQWAHIYKGGKLLGPLSVFISSLSYGVAAYRLSRSASPSADWRLFAAAGVAAFAIIPYTIALLGPLNRRGLELVEQPALAQTEEPARLVREWGRWNRIRALILAGSCAVGLVGIVGV